MNTSLKLTPIWLASVLACVLSFQAHAALITNGGFESGFSGWTRNNQLGSEGTYMLQTGTSSPVNMNVVPAPPGGSTAAMTDAAGPGSHVLFQTFVATAPMPEASLVFDLYVGNRAGAFFAPATLDFSTPTLNQQARVDILSGAADPFSMAGSDILLNAFRTNAGDPAVSGYTRHFVDMSSLLSSHLNTPLLLRFAEVDNVGIFQFGVDNVDIQVVPEPSSSFMVIIGLLGAACARRARRAVR